MANAGPSENINEKKVVKCLVNVVECQLGEFRKDVEKYFVPSTDDEPPLKIFKSENEPLSAAASYSEPGFKILESDVDHAASNIPAEMKIKSENKPQPVVANINQSNVDHSAPDAGQLKQEWHQSDNDPLLDHVVPSKIKYTWQCARCSFRAIKAEDLGIAQLPDGRWQCNVCHCNEKSRVFKSRSAKGNSIEHFKKFHWDPPEMDSHPCQNCDKHFQEDTATCIEYIQQGQVVTEKISGTWLCPNCSVNPNIKPEDFIAPLDDGTGRWKCKECNKIFKSRSAKGNTIEHVKSIHLEQRTECLPCPRCPEHYQVFSQFKRHLLTRHNLDFKTLMKNEKVRN